MYEGEGGTAGMHGAGVPDLSAKRMADLAASGVDIVELLGQSFQSIVDFYKSVEGDIVPRTMKALSGLVPCAVSLRSPGPDQSHRGTLKSHLAGSLCSGSFYREWHGSLHTIDRPVVYSVLCLNDKLYHAARCSAPCSVLRALWMSSSLTPVMA